MLQALLAPARDGEPRIAPAPPRELGPLARIVASVTGRVTGTPPNIFHDSRPTPAAVPQLCDREAIELCLLIGHYQGLASAIGGLAMQTEEG